MNNNRNTEIIRLLSETYGLTVKDLAKKLGVSEMTIRRDLKTLEKNGYVKFVSGAVFLQNNRYSFKASYSVKDNYDQQIAEKKSICKAAASLITNGDIVYFDIGSTVPLVIDYLPEKCNISALCCTTSAFTRLYEKNIEKITLLGGEYYRDLEMFFHSSNIQIIKSLRMTKAFISAAGIIGDDVTCINAIESPIKKAVMVNAVENYLLVDSTKFGLVSPQIFASISDFSAIITDSGVSEDIRRDYHERGIKLIIA